MLADNGVYPNLVRISFQFGGISEHGSHIHPSGRTFPSLIIFPAPYLEVIQRTFNLTYILVTYMRIYLCRLRTFMPQQLLDIPQVCTAFQQMCGETMPKKMNSDILFNVCLFTSICEYLSTCASCYMLLLIMAWK